jgi:flagellar hook protein FlgE
MSLGSVLQTALSGLSAAQFGVGVTANNLANARTAGFKQSRAVETTQALQTESRGAAPSRSGGANPLQVGLGVRPASTLMDVSQGSLTLNSRPLSLALEGDGYFMLEGSQGERLYTRNGDFGQNAAGELVSQSGNRVLGLSADKNFQIQEGRLGPLAIRSGMQVQGQDGSTATLTGFQIEGDGRIRGSFSDGVRRDLGQIQVARFANPSGLVGRSDTQYTAGPNSGLPVEGDPQSGGAASVVAGAAELSNTDLGRNLVDLFDSSNQFRANLQVMSVSEELFSDLLSIHRSR